MTTKCCREDCQETFSGDKKPEGWVSLSLCCACSGVVFYCPKHAPEALENAHAHMLEHEENALEGN